MLLVRHGLAMLRSGDTYDILRFMTDIDDELAVDTRTVPGLMSPKKLHELTPMSLTCVYIRR